MSLNTLLEECRALMITSPDNTDMFVDLLSKHPELFTSYTNTHESVIGMICFEQSRMYFDVFFLRHKQMYLVDREKVPKSVEIRYGATRQNGTAVHALMSNYFLLYTLWCNHSTKANNESAAHLRLHLMDVTYMLEYLLKYDREVISFDDLDGRNLLHFAALQRVGTIHFFRTISMALAFQGKSISELIIGVDNYGNTPLSLVLKQTHEDENASGGREVLKYFKPSLVYVPVCFFCDLEDNGKRMDSVLARKFFGCEKRNRDNDTVIDDEDEDEKERMENIEEGDDDCNSSTACTQVPSTKKNTRTSS